METPVYSFRRNALVPERTYRLAPDALEGTGSGRNARIPFEDITEIRFYQYKVRGAIGAKRSRQWRCCISRHSGPSVSLLPTHWLGFGIREDRSDNYYAFLGELAARMGTSNPNVKIVYDEHWSLSANRLVGSILGHIVVLARVAIRYPRPDRAARVAGWFMSKAGRFLRWNRVAQENLLAAFPDKTAAEREAILAGMWDNVGRLGVEFAHLEWLWSETSGGADLSQLECDEATIARLARLRSEGKPALFFIAHLAHFGLGALAIASYCGPTAVVYRRPNIALIADKLPENRSRLSARLIRLGPGLALRIRAALNSGSHVVMAVDQHSARGIDVTFFGRYCKVDPALVRIMRSFGCPVHGARVVRLAGQSYRFELTEAITPPRDAYGQIDIGATMQLVTSQVEMWVREHPEQWLWMHRRWR